MSECSNKHVPRGKNDTDNRAIVLSADVVQLAHVWGDLTACLLLFMIGATPPSAVVVTPATCPTVE